MKICNRETVWIATAILLATVPASAETFHRQDGVVFEGTIRRVVPNASVCNVLEEKYSPDEYERLKGNQGRPLDLWQVDYTVRNESGRALEHLRASGWVRSEHPPCTNWSGEGPGRGPVLPEPSLPIPIYWTDNYEMLQMPYGMRRGQQVRRSFYLEVFHENQPRFGEWDIDYTFAKEAGAGRGTTGQGGGSTQHGRGPEAPATALELPPEIEADRYLLQAEQAVREGDVAAARTAMERLEALGREYGLEPAAEDHFRYAQAWAAAGEPERAMVAVVQYLRLEGREAEHYTEALELLNRAESGKLGPAGDETRAQSPEPSCAGQERGAECWMELESHPDCYVWGYFYPGVTWTWSAGCIEGMANGSGTLKLINKSNEIAFELTGRVQNGKLNGHWVIRDGDGDLGEGPYVDGKRHGAWVERFAHGDVYEGQYVDGKRHGRWVQRLADGTVNEGPYVDGKRHGAWVERSPSGRTETVTYVNGVRQ